MLYLVCGEDAIRSKKRLVELKALWRKKYPTEPIIVFDEDNFSSGEFKNIARGNSLFHKKHLIVLNRVLQNEEFLPDVLKILKELQASTDVFLFWNDKIQAKIKKSFEKHKAKIEIFESPKKYEAKPEPNLFPLLDAVFEKRKRLALKLFYRALGEGIGPEEIFWRVWWGLKTLYAIAAQKNINLHPFVAKKYLPCSRGFSKEKLEEMLKAALLSYHYSKLGFRELNDEIELFILKL